MWRSHASFLRSATFSCCRSFSVLFFHFCFCVKNTCFLKLDDRTCACLEQVEKNQFENKTCACLETSGQQNHDFLFVFSSVRQSKIFSRSKEQKTLHSHFESSAKDGLPFVIICIFFILPTPLRAN